VFEARIAKEGIYDCAFSLSALKHVRSKKDPYTLMRMIIMCSVLYKSIPKWSISKSLFDMVSLLNLRIKYKLNKLLGYEWYSSAKLEVLGFKAQKTLKDINETDF
jgi:hypothetical protein